MKTVALWTLLYFAGHGAAPVTIPVNTLADCKHIAANIVEPSPRFIALCGDIDAKCRIENDLSRAICLGPNGSTWKSNLYVGKNLTWTKVR